MIDGRFGLHRSDYFFICVINGLIAVLAAWNASYLLFCFFNFVLFIDCYF